MRLIKTTSTSLNGYKVDRASYLHDQVIPCSRSSLRLRLRLSVKTSVTDGTSTSTYALSSCTDATI